MGAIKLKLVKIYHSLMFYLFSEMVDPSINFMLAKGPHFGQQNVSLRQNRRIHTKSDFPAVKVKMDKYANSIN
jgi:hypothetical protein